MVTAEMCNFTHTESQVRPDNKKLPPPRPLPHTVQKTYSHVINVCVYNSLPDTEG